MHYHDSLDKNELKKDARKLAKIENTSQRFLIVPDRSIYNLRKYVIDDVMICQIEEVISHI